MNEIKKELGVSKSSISLWVKNIELTKDQKQELSNKGVKKEIIEKRRATRFKNENNRRQIIIDKAREEINNLSLQDLKILGIALYWAEGGKTQRGLVRIANGDPKIIEIMMEFLRKICYVPEKKFRGHIHIHPHLNIKKAENYWSSVSKIPLSQFYKTYSKHNISSQNKKNSLPFGTFDIYVCNTKLFLKIKGWTEGIYKNIINMPG